MLDSTVAMLKLFFAFMLFLMQDSPASVTSPKTGEELRGQVQIVGNMAVPNFSWAELAFAYATPEGGASNSADTWFVIQTFPQPAVDSALAVWDTTTLTDGEYNLRLRIFLIDGTFQDVIVSDLKIRNDAPLPAEVVLTETPLPQFSFATSLPLLTKLPVTAAVTYPSSTPLPVNPASVTTSSIYFTFGRGALIVLVLFVFFSLILRLRKNT
ncbi:MAG: hypothetical protein IH588_12820 [Anaerolineales bacterium]|nr:hypothetical protein [Anaerolineales bacterium]